LYKLIDAHAHLEQVEDLGAALARAREIGVSAIITAGSDYHSSRWALRVSSKWKHSDPKVYATIGVHPLSLDSSKIDRALKFIQKNIGKAVGVGEIGLDYWLKDVRKDPNRKELQKRVFKNLLEIAKEHGKPVVIHSRGAWKDCFEMVKEAKVEKAVFHWFSGPIDVLESLLKEKYLISATPAAAYSKEHRTAIQTTPIENILLETDSPVMYRGKTSEPADVISTLSEVAALKDMEKEAVANKTTRNGVELFSIEI
jgi:TatD DNase family protein